MDGRIIQTTIKDQVIKSFNSFMVYMNTVSTIDSKTRTDILQRHEVTLKLCARLPADDKPLQTLLEILVYSASSFKLNDNVISAKCGLLISALTTEIFNNKAEYRKYCVHENYLTDLLITWVNLTINSYDNNQQDVYLVGLEKIRILLEMLLKHRGTKVDMIGMLLEFFIARTYYVYEFVKYYQSGKLSTKTFLDRTNFDTIYNAVKGRLETENQTADQRCYLLLFDAYYCNINYYSLTDKHISNKEKILRQTFIQSFEQLMPRFEELCDGFDSNHKESAARQTPLPSGLGYSICMLLSLYTENALFISEVNNILQQAILAIKATKDMNNELTRDHIKFLSFKLKLYHFHNLFVRESLLFAPVDTAPTSKRLAELKLHLDAATKLAETQATLAKEELSKEPERPAKVKRSLQPNLFAMQIIRKKLKENANSQNTKSENKPKIKRAYPELKQIPTLLQQRNYKGSSTISHRSRLDAEKKNDLASLLEIYTTIGDINIAWAQTKSSKVRQHKLDIATKYYKRALFILDQILSEKRDEHLLSLKDIILKCIPEKFKCEPEPEPILASEMPKPNVVNIDAPDGQMTQLPQPFDLPDYLENIAERLMEAGHNVYLVGGAVADYPNPPNDYDLTTSASIHQVTGIFPEGMLIIGKHPIVVLKGYEKEIQISTLQSNSNTDDIEVFTSKNDWVIYLHRTKNLYDDAKRRAFTCNALIYDFCYETVIDYFHGLEHISDRVIQFIEKPERALRRDPTLVFRALRLVINKGYKLKPEDEMILEHTPLNPIHAQHELIKSMQTKEYKAMFSKLRQLEIFKRLYSFTFHQTTYLCDMWQYILLQATKTEQVVLLWSALIYTQSPTTDNLAETLIQFSTPTHIRNQVSLILHIVSLKQKNQTDLLIKMSYKAEEFALATTLHAAIKTAQQSISKSISLGTNLFQREGNTDPVVVSRMTP